MIQSFWDEANKIASLSGEMDQMLSGGSVANDADLMEHQKQQRRYEERSRGALTMQPGLPPGQDLPSMGQDLNESNETYRPSNEGYGG